LIDGRRKHLLSVRTQAGLAPHHHNLEKIILAISFVSMIPAFISAGRVYL